MTAEAEPTREAPTNSLLRLLQHEALASVRLDGAVLDVGGSRRSAYHRYLQGDHAITFANLDLSWGADIEFDAEKPWPLEGESYDGVVMSNLLEHLFDYQTALSEARRVLRPGGRFVATVPFLLRVHATPGDFFRYTGFALERMLTKAGFTAIEVSPLGGGVFSAVYQTGAALLKPRFVAVAARKAARGLDRLLAKLRPGSAVTTDFVLGYMVVAERPMDAAGEDPDRET